jgi:hypothetical protein
MSYQLYYFYTVAYLALLAYGALLWHRRHQASTLFLLLVTFGVFYDNLILTLGNWLGTGALLLGLSAPRFVLHQMILPWIIYAAYDQARQAGQRWAQPPAMRWIAILLSAAVMVAGIATRLWTLHLEPVVMDGVLRYVAVDTVGPPIVSIVSIGVVGVVGLVFWRSNHWPWIFLAVVAAFIGETLPDESQRRVIGSALEFVLMAILFVTQQRLDTGRMRGR